MRATDLQGLVDAADDAALLRAIDQLCGLTAWDELVDLARRCDDAVEFGRQLWGVRQHIEYRLALEAPPPWAGPVVRPGAARFALGPLTEVVAERFAWHEIAPHLPDPVAAATVAAERALRGEDLRKEPVAADADLPLALAGFEPDYRRPAYRDREARFPAPSAPAREAAQPWRLDDADPAVAAPDAAVAALVAVADGWTGSPREPGLRRRAVRAATGEVRQAVAALADGGPVRAAPASSAEALAWLQWAGASGGAGGHRRGGAAGRFAAWSALAAVAGLDWPPVVDDDLVAALAEAAGELRWWRWWRDDEPDAGWVVRLAVADSVDGEAYALEAVDPPLDEPA